MLSICQLGVSGFILYYLIIHHIRKCELRSALSRVSKKTKDNKDIDREDWAELKEEISSSYAYNHLIVIYPILGGGSGWFGAIWGLVAAYEDCPDIIPILWCQVIFNGLNFFLSLLIYWSSS